MPCSSLHHIIRTSAIGELVIQLLEPFKIWPPSTVLEFVFIEAGSEPASDSVKPKQPISSPLAIFGRYSCF